MAQSRDDFPDVPVFYEYVFKIVDHAVQRSGDTFGRVDFDDALALTPPESVARTRLALAWLGRQLQDLTSQATQAAC